MPVHWIKHCTSFNYGNPIINGRNALVLTAVDLGWHDGMGIVHVLIRLCRIWSLKAKSHERWDMAIQARDEVSALARSSR